MLAWRRRAALMAALVLAACVVTLAVGERIGVNDGEGWDGMSYTEWAQHFDSLVLHDGLTRFHSQRVLPSGLLFYILRALDIARTVPHVLTAFAVLNTLLLTASAVLWAHLGEAMTWRRAAAWAGFVALFGSFANLRHALYYPALTDPSAFALGLAMTWAYMTNRPLVLWLVAALGSLTWPALPPLALALLVLPRPAEPVAPEARWQRLQQVTAAVVALALAAVFLLIARHYLLDPLPALGDAKFAEWVRRDLLAITVPGLVIALAGGWYVLLRQSRLWNVRGYVATLRRRRTLVALAGAAAVLVLHVVWLATIGTQGEGPTPAQFMCEHTLSALRGPLWGLVHHVVYFGPIVLVAVLAWRRIAARAAEWGPAALLALVLVVAFAAGSNSRQWNHLVPFLVAATIAVTDELWTMRRVALFAAITLAWSKVWLRIGYDTPEQWWAFPDQRYFMNHGPYANDTMWLVHLVAAVVTGVLLWLLLFRRRPTAS